MSLAINTTRMERQVRNLGRAALFVSVALLIVITGMTARYGWTQTPGGWEDKISVKANVAAVVELCNSKYASRRGVSEAQASKWKNRFIREGVAQHEWRGQRKVLVKKRVRALQAV
jgi:hypothetical protein